MLNLYSIVSEQFPEFVRTYYPTLIEFVKEYYKWLKIHFGDDYKNLIDIDKAPEDFVSYFKSQYDNENLLKNDFEPFYIKRLKEIYSAKGSEQALIKLLKIVYDTDATISYPGEQILRASDGKWIQESFINLTDLYGTIIPSNVDFFYLKINGIEKRIRLNRSEVLQSGMKRVYFDSINKIDFDENQYITFKDDGNIVYVGTIIKDAASLTITSAGTNWQVSQIFTIPGTRDSIGKVVKVGTSGEIKAAIIYEYGEGHTENQLVTVYPNHSNIPEEAATIKVIFKTSSKIEGKWIDDDGKISNPTIKLEDNFFYQNFSYVVESDLNSDKYKELATSLNPAGYKLFTSYNLKSNLSLNVVGETRTPFLYLYFSELVNTTENRTFNLSKVASDVVSALDQLARVVSKNIDNLDSFAIVTDSNTKHVQKSLSETVTATDNIVIIVGIVRDLADIATASEQNVKLFSKAISDTSTTSETLVLQPYKYLNEISTANDGSFQSLTTLKYSSEDYFSEDYEGKDLTIIIGV